VASLLGWSCGAAEEPSPAASSSPAAAATPGASANPGRPSRGGLAPVATSGEEPYPSAELGALHGTVLFEGTPPERFELGATEKRECKHHPEVDQRSNVLVVDEGKLAGVLVHLRSGYDEKAIPPAPSTPVTLDQRGCMYVPRVLALQLGQKLLVTNSDPTNHNVHTRPKKNAESNKNMGITKDALEIAFEHAEKVPFACDFHPWMGALVFVEEHPWFAVSDEHGAFRIRAVPPGEYVVEGVHENLGSVAGSVKVSAGKSTGFTLTLRAKK
jgi:plastocyanin